jgi:hypothetical protein
MLKLEMRSFFILKLICHWIFFGHTQNLIIALY